MSKNFIIRTKLLRTKVVWPKLLKKKCPATKCFLHTSLEIRCPASPDKAKANIFMHWA
jgi:hypothetical protein